MTKEEFEVFQLDLQQSGKPLMSYLKDAGVKYSTYTYWRRKMEYEHKPELPIAPISLTQSHWFSVYWYGFLWCDALIPQCLPFFYLQ